MSTSEAKLATNKSLSKMIDFYAVKLDMVFVLRFQ